MTLMYYGALAARSERESETLVRRAPLRAGLEVLCAWCLAEEGITFPPAATSTICAAHAERLLAQRAAQPAPRQDQTPA